MDRRKWLAIPMMAVGLAPGGSALAATTGNLAVQITIVADCQLQSGALLDFGSHGVLVANVDASATLSITCTPSTAYSVGLSAGLHATPSTDINDRHLANGSTLIAYQLYKPGGYTAVWGDTTTDLVTGTGSGSAQSYTVNGRVPPQATPATGLYQDTVTVTMTF